MSACYIIAAWGGKRRKHDPMGISRKGDFFVREHIARISACKNINRIVVASPLCDRPRSGYEEYLLSLEATKEINGIPVEVLRRPNIGMSYGSYNDAYGKYRTSYDFYFVAEDDYLPALPEFDRILLDMMGQRPACGFLCALNWPNPNKPDHAGIFVGLMRTEALEKLWLKRGCLARFHGNGYEEAEYTGQIRMSWAIVEAGYEIRDWTASYSSPYWHETGLKTYGDPKLPALYVPGQIVRPNVP